MPKEIKKYGLMQGTRMNVWRFSFVFGGLAVSILLGGLIVYWKQGRPEKESTIFGFAMQKQWDDEYERRLAEIKVRRAEQIQQDKAENAD